ncbi:hypothetical protein [Streptomyces chrestomyceticus]|uniref:hypothetical protein n=1 Tax=Streptomyces chrestomyceticus TaxID=68185 RepID=UPI0035A8DE19
MTVTVPASSTADKNLDAACASLAQLLTVAAHAAERMELDGDGEVSCPLHEAAALITGNAGLQTTYAPPCS